MVTEKEPSCLDEIPKVTFSEKMIPYIELKDVKRLVCRRIIELTYEKGQKRLDNENTNRVLELCMLFNITDAMIEEERKRLKR